MAKVKTSKAIEKEAHKEFLAKQREYDRLARKQINILKKSMSAIQQALHQLQDTPVVKFSELEKMIEDDKLKELDDIPGSTENP